MPISSWGEFVREITTEDHDGRVDAFADVGLLRPGLIKRLIAGIHFSRSFLVTYHLACSAIVFLFALHHCYTRITRRQRRGLVRRVPPEQLASSGSTITGDATPPDITKVQDETSPLIGHEGGSRKPTSSVSHLWRKLRALLMHQPAPLPLTRQTLPSNATTLLILALLALNLFYLLYRVPFELDLTFIFADRAGLLFVVNLPWLYLLAAKTQPLKFLTGYSYENNNILHRRLGEWMCLAAIIHGIFMFVAWCRLFLPLGRSIGDFLLERIIILGLAALFCYEILFATSLAAFRQWWYEMFLGTHIVLQAAGLALVFFHHSGGRVYAAIALAIFLVDRLVFRLAMKTRNIEADLTVMEDGETVLLSADWPITSRWHKLWSALFGLNIRHGWKPSEHIFLTVPALASKHVFQAHPFTIASAAPENGNRHAWFSLIIRAHDGFTRDLLRFAKSHSRTPVRLDGPYGSLHALEMLRSSDIALLVVGGSGVAVAYPLLWTLLHEEDGTGAERLAQRKRKLGLIWVVHESSHLEWIGHERLDELREMGAEVCIPPPTAKAGRPCVRELIRDTIDKLGRGGVGRDVSIGVVVSGPDGMNTEARNTCATLAWEGRDVEVAVEKYGW